MFLMMPNFLVYAWLRIFPLLEVSIVMSIGGFPDMLEFESAFIASMVDS